MDASVQPQLDIEAVRDRQVVLRSIVLFQQSLVLVALLIGTLVAPITAVAPADSDEPAEPRGLFDSLLYFSAAEPEAFGDRDTHPNALDGGLLFTRVGLVLMLVVVLGTLLAVVLLWAGFERGRRPALIALGIALVLSGGLTFLGLGVLPDGDLVTTTTGWLWLPIAAGAWAIYHLRARDRLG